MVFCTKTFSPLTVPRRPAGREPTKLAKLEVGLSALCVENSTQGLSSTPAALAKRCTTVGRSNLVQMLHYLLDHRTGCFQRKSWTRVRLCVSVCAYPWWNWERHNSLTYSFFKKRLPSVFNQLSWQLEIQVYLRIPSGYQACLDCFSKLKMSKMLLPSQQ